MIKLPNGVNLNDLLQFLRNIGLKSSSMLRNFEEGTKLLYDSSENLIINKDINDPVTEADLKLNKYITDEFLRKFPSIDWEVVTEENSKEISFKESKSDWVWFIDPLDGTKDFIQKSGEFAIHIALTFKNRTILGLVLLPSINEMWFGVNGIGTWKEIENQYSETKNPILGNQELISFSKSEVVNVVTSKNHINQKLEIILQEMKYQNILRMGSIGYKVCSLLRNEADLYISISGKTAPKDWDIAAPHALIDNAKCNFTYASGNNIDYQKNNYLQEGCLIASTLSRKEHLIVCKKVNKIIDKFDLQKSR